MIDGKRYTDILSNNFMYVDAFEYHTQKINLKSGDRFEAHVGQYYDPYAGKFSIHKKELKK